MGADVNETIGREMQRLRVQAGMSQRDVAAELRCGAASVSRFENGQAALTVPQLLDVSTLLGLDPVRLLGWTQAPAPSSLEDIEDPETERLRARLLQATETVKTLQESVRQNLVMTRCWSDRCILYPGHRQEINPGCHFDGARWYYSVEPDDAQD